MVNNFLKTSKLLLVLVGSMISQSCLSQTYQELNYIIDTTAAKMDSYNAEKTYYDSSVIICKSRYNKWPNNIHFEFVRIIPNKYYCIEYNLNGQVIREGVAVKETTPYDTLKIPIYDSSGNITSYGGISLYKFCKDEFWYEDIDSAIYYKYGKYFRGLKDSIWLETRNRVLENELYYNKGELVKQIKVNFTDASTNKIREALGMKWILNSNTYSQPWNFIPADKSNAKNKCDFIQFNKDGTVKFCINIASYENEKIEEGKWDLIENNTKIKLTFKNSTNEAKIEYVGKYGLTLLFQ